MKDNRKVRSTSSLSSARRQQEIDQAQRLLDRAREDLARKSSLSVRILPDSVVLQIAKRKVEKDLRHTPASGSRSGAYMKAVQELYRASVVETEQLAATVQRRASEKEKLFYQQLLVSKRS